MKDKHNLPKRLVRGKTGQQEAKAPIIGGGGRIDTSLKDINWTPAKLGIVSTVLLAPFTFAIVVAFHSGNALVGLILVGLGVFVGLLYLALRYIDNNEF
jgi:hypothetical protein